MKTINEYKDVLREIKEDVLIKSNELECYDSYFRDIILESVEEDIALWKKGNHVYKDWHYFYTDLEGNLLFNDEIFKYATPFSNSRAFVNNFRECLILDLERKEIISLPKELTFLNINNFRNDNLALFDRNSYSWGSVRYNPDEKSFKKDIPFIWDALEFSRLKDQVYVGIHNVSSNPYWIDDPGTKFTICTMKLSINDAKNLDCYNYRKNIHTGAINKDTIRYIQEEISNTTPEEEKKQLVKDYLKTAYNISDYYFEEEYKEELNNNKGNMVDAGNIDCYQKKLGKLVK